MKMRVIGPTPKSLYWPHPKEGRWQCLTVRGQEDITSIRSSKVSGAARRPEKQLWRWVIEHRIPREEISGEPTGYYSNYKNQKKSKMDKQEVEGHCSNKMSWSLAQYLNLSQLLDTEKIAWRSQTPKWKDPVISQQVYTAMFPHISFPDGPIAITQ